MPTLSQIVAFCDTRTRRAEVKDFPGAYNGLQVENNGEPFWTGFVNSDVSKSLAAAGFDAEKIFEFYKTLGRGDYLLFGAQK